MKGGATYKATQKRKEMAKEADVIIIQYLKDTPASTIYSISKSLGWTTGKVQGSVNRIKDHLIVKDIVENGRLKRKYSFPIISSKKLIYPKPAFKTPRKKEDN